MSDFDKVKVINKYLIDRYRYDDSLISNNAYSALMTGKTTCQGYALTAYKMLKLSGIENRIVTGELEGVPHGWNLVKLNNKWYHLDITNNDALSSDKYFLKSDKDLKRDGFTWKYNDYPACDEDYNELSNNNLNVNLSVTNNVTKGLSGSIQQATTGYKAKLDGNWISKNNSWFL